MTQMLKTVSAALLAGAFVLTFLMPLSTQWRHPDGLPTAWYGITVSAGLLLICTSALLLWQRFRQFTTTLLLLMSLLTYGGILRYQGMLLTEWCAWKQERTHGFSRPALPHRGKSKVSETGGQANIREEVLVVEDAGAYRVIVKRQGRVLWSAPTVRSIAINDVKNERIIYAGTNRPIVLCRTYSGKLVWQVSVGEMVYAPDMYVAGGNALICHIYNHGYAAKYFYLSHARDDIRSDEQACLDIRTGRTGWVSNELEIGKPIWTDGIVFATIRVDLAKSAIARVARQDGHLSVYLEKRLVKNSRLLWRKRLPGLPGKLLEAKPQGASLEFVFKDSQDDREFLNVLSDFRTTMPMTGHSPNASKVIEFDE